MFLQIRYCFLIHRENPVLSAGFNGHIGNGQTVIHGEICHSVSGELQRFVQRAVHADLTDQVKNHILAAYPLSGFSGQDNPDGGRHLEPGLSGSHSGCHVCTSHPGGKSAQRSVSTGMGIRADNYVAGDNQSLFRKQGVFYAHLPDIKIICNLVFVGELSDLLTVLSRFDILVRDKVIHHQGNFVTVKDLLFLESVHLVNGNRRRNIISQYKIQLCLDQLTGLHKIKTRGMRKDLLSHCHSHPEYSSLKSVFYL